MSRFSFITLLPRRLYWALLALVFIVAVGTTGYIVIEGWVPIEALYMTIITVTTVGFGEVHPLSPGGRLFSIFLIVFGVGGGLYTITTLVEWVMEGQFQGPLRERRMKDRIARLRNHYIVAGYGLVGREIGREFSREGIPFVAIDTKPPPEEEGLLYIQGDATNDEVLGAAGLDRARGLVVATGSDADNTFITLSARAARPDLIIVSRSNTPDTEAKLRRAGADRVINPHNIGGRRMALLTLRPLVVDFIDSVIHDPTIELFLEDMEVKAQSPLAGITVREGVERCGGATILAVRRAEGTLLLNPPRDAVIQVGDQVVVMGTREQLRAMEGMGR